MDTNSWCVITFLLTSILWFVLTIIAQSKNSRHAEITFMDGSKRSTQIAEKQFGTIYTDFGTFRADEKGVWRSSVHSEITLKVL